jgi:antitoxin PrlF
MSIEVVNLSSKGQLVIPKSMRKEVGLNDKDKIILVNDKDTIILKKIKEDEIKQRMTTLMKTFSSEFKKAGITKEDLKNEIKNTRKAK